MPDPRDEREHQPWHPADEKPKGGAPVGTQSLTGGGPDVGMPVAGGGGQPERSQPQDLPEAAQPDPLAEPRADTAGIRGPKP